jgi:phospholipid/cholesterol/gamma-HCH transport system ATP-binding protein
MDGRETVISVEGLTVRYGDNTVLDNVSFEVYRGEIFDIAGGSGCGKSTLLKHVIGLETPVSGKIVINGIDTSEVDDKGLEKLRKESGCFSREAPSLVP